MTIMVEDDLVDKIEKALAAAMSMALIHDKQMWSYFAKVTNDFDEVIDAQSD